MSGSGHVEQMPHMEPSMRCDLCHVPLRDGEPVYLFTSSSLSGMGVVELIGGARHEICPARHWDPEYDQPEFIPFASRDLLDEVLLLGCTSR